MSKTSCIEQYSKDECRRENHHIGYVLSSCLHCVHQRSLDPMMYLVWSSGEGTIRYSLVGSQEHPSCSEQSSVHLKQFPQCSSGMSQLFLHGIQGLIRGEVRGEDGGSEGLPSRLREEKVGMSGLPTDITRRLPEAGGGEGRMWRGRGGASSIALVAALAW